MWSVRTLCLLLALALPCSAAEVQGDTSLLRFEAELVSVERLQQPPEQDYTPCDRRPRFVLALRHDKGRLHYYGVHSASRTFLGAYVLGRRYRFKLLTYRRSGLCYLYLCDDADN